MALTIDVKYSGGKTKTIVLADTKVLKLLVDGVEDSDFTITNSTGGNLNVEVSVKANG
jgi:hypothetical protein